MSTLLGLLACTSSLDRKTSEDSREGSASASRVIPFELASDIIIEAEVNGVELRLAVDNGVLWDPLLLYGRPKLDRLGLQYDGELQIGAPGDANATAARTASGLTLEIGEWKLEDQAAVVTAPDSRFSRLFVGHDGIISGTLFRHSVVRIDFDRREITLIDPADFDPEQAGEAFPLTPTGRGSFGVPATIRLGEEDSIAIRPTVDLGGIQPLLLYLRNRPDIRLPETARPGEVAAGESGFFARAAELCLGSYRLTNVETAFTEHPALMGPACDGLLGLPLLSRFDLTFDYGTKTLYLKPNARFSRDASDWEPRSEDR